jgi:hypothetical protein
MLRFGTLQAGKTITGNASTIMGICLNRVLTVETNWHEAIVAIERRQDIDEYQGLERWRFLLSDSAFVPNNLMRIRESERPKTASIRPT